MPNVSTFNTLGFDVPDTDAPGAPTFLADPSIDGNDVTIAASMPTLDGSGGALTGLAKFIYGYNSTEPASSRPDLEPGFVGFELALTPADAGTSKTVTFPKPGPGRWFVSIGCSD